MTVEIKKDDTVYCFTRHVSKSGMTRHISFYVIRDNKPCWINYKIEKTLGYKPNKYLDSDRCAWLWNGYGIQSNL